MFSDFIGYTITNSETNYQLLLNAFNNYMDMGYNPEDVQDEVCRNLRIDLSTDLLPEELNRLNRELTILWEGKNYA